MVSFDYNSLCPVETGIDYMAILVVFEVILLAIILSKLSYDVLQYRRTGELPWLARHICLGYSYTNINKPNNNDRHSQTVDRKRNGTTLADDTVQFVDTNSESPTSLSDRMTSVKCLTDCFRCVGFCNESEAGSSSNNLDKNSTKSRDIVMFRPRRQTENSANHSNGSGPQKSSPISLSAVTLRKTSKMGPLSPRKSPPLSKSPTAAIKLPTLLPTNKLLPNKDKADIFEVHHNEEDRDRKVRIIFKRGLKGSTSEDRLSFRTVMEPMPTHSRTFTSPDSRFLNKSRIQRNISRSTSTLQNSVAL